MKKIIANFLTDPLCHFAAFGGLLFLVFSLLERPIEPEINTKIIRVDQQVLLTFLQYRSAAFDPETFENVLGNMSDSDRRMLIDDYVRSEVLLREADAIGLTRDDAVIRQRLIQRMEFALQGLVAKSQSLSETDLLSYFEQTREFYRTEPALTFTHVFTRTQGLAVPLLDNLNSQEVSPAGSLEFGERFPYFTNYVDRTEEFIASHFGKEMTEQLFALPVGDGTWHGPLRSPLGFHIVQLTRSDPARLPELHEIRDRVLSDMQSAKLKKDLQSTISALISTYDVDVDFSSFGSE